MEASSLPIAAVRGATVVNGDRGKGWEIVPAGLGSGTIDEGAVYPLTLHEDQLRELLAQSCSSSSRRTLVQRFTGSVGRMVGQALGFIWSKVYLIFGGAVGLGSLATLAGLLGFTTYVRRRDQRERGLLLLLMQEKDLRINQMVQQITLINEMKTISNQISALMKS